MHHWKLPVWNVAFWRRKKTFKFCCSNIWSTITYKHSWPINTNSICKTHQTLSCLLCESLAYNFTQIKGGSASIWILYSSMIYPPPVVMYVTKVTDAQLLYTEKAVSDSRFQHHLLQAVFLFTHLNHLQRHQGKRNFTAFSHEFRSSNSLYSHVDAWQLEIHIFFFYLED